MPKIAAKLKTLSQVGGLCAIGTISDHFVGGEAQRIKLALELSKRQQGRTLYILGEPTTGLHASDIQNLMDLLFQLRDETNTIVMIEHDLNVIALAIGLLVGPVGALLGGMYYMTAITPFFR